MRETKKVPTSYVERSNLNMRMDVRHFTRLTNAFSKKAENHAHAGSLQFMAHNLLRARGTLTKAARRAQPHPRWHCGLTDHVWTVEALLSKTTTTFQIAAYVMP